MGVVPGRQPCSGLVRISETLSPPPPLTGCPSLRVNVCRLLRQPVPFYPAASHAPRTSSTLFPSWHLLLPGFIFLFVHLLLSCLSTPPSIKAPYRIGLFLKLHLTPASELASSYLTRLRAGTQFFIVSVMLP